ncbi:hypothetical protein Tco_0446950, partial [Tanacetum coccineum]
RIMAVGAFGTGVGSVTGGGVAPGFNLVGLPLGAIFLNHKKT